MSDHPAEEIFTAYKEQFGQHPPCEPNLLTRRLNEYLELLNHAIQRGAPLTLEELEAKFGPISWDW
ncbi:MAG: hypothetical protein N3B01_01420 [Verrucomicrobiae bacterium]|nr:hypothetical protein [Verrucomicrobiae bacterium]